MAVDDLGLAREVDAEAIGEPGKRVFRLRVVGEHGEAASVWLEKEQLQALALAIRQVLAQLNYQEEAGVAPHRISDFPEQVDAECKAGRMGMGYSEPDRSLVLFVYEIGADEDAEPTMILRISQDQATSLGHVLEEIIAGGRPICFLCGSPIDPGGHVCARANGHFDQPIPKEPDEEE